MTTEPVISINHPVSAIWLWLDEAGRMQRYACQAPPRYGIIFLARSSVLLDCARHLYNRLLWSGMLP